MLRPNRDARGSKRQQGSRNRRCGEREIEMMGNRPGPWSTAEGTSLEIGVASPRVMLVMRRHPGGNARAQLQEEGRAGCRHETRGNVGAKQQQGQQQDAGPRTLPLCLRVVHVDSRILTPGPTPWSWA